MSIKSDLEKNRVQELDDLLSALKPKILEYISQADPNSSNYKSSSLGTYHEPRFLREKLITSSGNNLDKPCTPEQLAETIDKVLEYSVNTWNPGFLDKLYASNNPIGVVSDILLSILNTNSHVYTVSPVLSVLENYIGHKYASLFFTNNQETCGGLTFSGGSWSNITSMQIARSLKYPETKSKGNAGYKFAIYTSKHCHYSVVKGAILLGLGSENVFKVDVTPQGLLNVLDLENVIEETIKKGFTPLYINATAGTTVFGSFDPFIQIHKVAKKYNVYFHIDGSWGGNVIFSPHYKNRLQGCEFADSITVNPHKMLGIPTTCSFLLLPHVGNFQATMSLQAPYLFHGRDNPEEGNYDLADGTMGCGRRADSFKFYLAWLYYGESGFQDRVDHAFKIQGYFVDKIKANSAFEIVGPKFPQCLQVCFYYHPPNIKASNTEITRYISRELHKLGKYLVDFSPNPEDDSKGEFFRVVFNSPILTDKIVDDLYDSIVQVGQELE
ncbi:GAD2 [Candida oxycetoniae]|uniref:GAD2 n=1 Tax=Candida oxycetoniae TaxID=497107 RepID=A0AAI9SVY4_9ASCO|nr:GAD2 [Candida oxycetoniae]KAI3403947.1 GAD2 [Candida oxycetoniae]